MSRRQFNPHLTATDPKKWHGVTDNELDVRNGIAENVLKLREDAIERKRREARQRTYHKKTVKGITAKFGRAIVRPVRVQDIYFLPECGYFFSYILFVGHSVQGFTEKGFASHAEAYNRLLDIREVQLESAELHLKTDSLIGGA